MERFFGVLVGGLLLLSVLVLLWAPGGRPRRNRQTLVFPAKVTGRIVCVLIFAIMGLFVVLVAAEPGNVGLWLGLLLLGGVAICGIRMWPNAIVLGPDGITTRRPWGSKVHMGWEHVASVEHHSSRYSIGVTIYAMDGTELYVAQLMHEATWIERLVRKRIAKLQREPIFTA